MKYRPEIDGLRAIAVGTVIFFHAGIAGFSGGFVGVDVFFVISGFLITQILISELSTDSFSIAQFYERRARRILPALYAVLAVSSALALFLMLPGTLMEFSRSVMATLLFVSNLWFWWRGADYFSPSAERDPMLHTWSLGVEEQYYLIFPLLMLLLWRLGRSRLALVIGVITALSLLLAEIGWRLAPEANFYLLPSRAWQLGLGSLGAFFWLRAEGQGPRVDPRLGEAAALLGLALVLGSVFAMDASVPFPSLSAALPTGGALLLLVFATRETRVGRLLAWGPLVTIGLMSYGAYLWHQPLLAFARIAAPDELTLAQKLGLCALTFALAWATLLLVERPFRRRDFLRQNQVFALSAVGGLALLVASGLAYKSGGFRDYYPEHLREIAGMSEYDAGAYVRRAYDAHGTSGFREGAGPRLLLIGDSFSQDFYNVIRETGAFPGYQIALRYVLARCQVYLGPEDISPLLAPGDRALCAQSTSAEDLVEIAGEADVVIFAASWRDWSAERLPGTLDRFGFRPDQRVLVLGRKAFYRMNRQVIAGRSPEDLAALRFASPSWHLETTELLRAELPDERLIDSQRLVCGGSSCPLFTPEGAPLSIDGAHLTRAGALHVGELLFASGPLASYRAPLPVTGSVSGPAAPKPSLPPG